MPLITDPFLGGETRQTGPIIAHHKIIEIADQMVQETYDLTMADPKEGNRLYKRWPNKKNFCNQFRELFVQAARDALVDRLADKNTPEALKQEIYDILLMDSAVPGAKNRGTFDISSAY